LCVVPPKFDAVFFATAAGREPVRDWLLGLPRSDRRVIGIDIAYVQWKWLIGKPRVDHLRGDIWEIRSRLEGRIARVLCAVAGSELILLHGFIKKSRKTPADDIDLAVIRWKEWLNGQGQ
jgi:phage-related protein